MSVWLYFVQTLIIASTLWMLISHRHWILRAQVAIWCAAVLVIAARFNLTGQLNFYSNDQRFYDDVVRNFASSARVLDADWLTSSSKLPFTLPAFLLYSFGVSSTLALKTVSIVCLLWLTNDVLDEVRPRTNRGAAIACVLTACGTIGVFYSTLALRETMMMLLATKFLFTKSPATRLASCALMFLLRPHLAVSLAMAALLVALWRFVRNHRPESVVTASGTVLLGSWLGYQLYSLGNSYLVGSLGRYGHTWGIEPVTRIASNFFGVQFLTADSETVEFSLSSLVLLRFVLIETLLIPTLFTVVAFAKPVRMNEQRITLLLAFSVYVGLVTNTDFNSFRQNIPFMAAMGLSVIAMLPSHRLRIGSSPSNATALPVQRFKPRVKS